MWLGYYRLRLRKVLLNGVILGDPIVMAILPQKYKN